MKISELPNTEKDAIYFFQDHGILQTSSACENGHIRKLYLGKKLYWKCNVKKCQSGIGIRARTWFEGSRLPFLTVVRFLYYWSEELSSVEFCKKELDMGKCSVVDWSMYCREVCASAVERSSNGKIGGEGLIVEIDESLFSKRNINIKNKDKCVRILPQQFVFGGVCKETQEMFVVLVPDRTAETLTTAIEENIKNGSTIVWDSWKAYKTDEAACSKQSESDTRYNFVDPDDSTHNQAGQKMWGSTNWRNKRHRGTAHQFLKSYFVEFMWREKVKASKQDPFLTLLDDIKCYWPPQ